MSDGPRHRRALRPSLRALRPSRRVVAVAGVIAVAVVAIAGGFVLVSRHRAATIPAAARPVPTTRSSSRSGPGRVATPAGPGSPAVVPLAVVSSDPPTGTTLTSGVGAFSFTTTARVDLAAGQPTLVPKLAGVWTSGAHRLTFQPSGAYPPDTTVTVTLPATLKTAAGARLGTAFTASYTVGSGSLTRAQQLLAMLGYLPLTWTPAGATAPATTAADLSAAAQQSAVFSPPAGTFAWTWASVPPSLAAEWTPGVAGPMTAGAVMAFESTHGLAVDGIIGPQVWAALVAATSVAAPVVNPNGYTYALASKTLPETLTVWRNGTVISQSAANTGIPAAPTADGTFPVYERLATQIMRGKNPDGSSYADPVAWVAYFNGGDAIHYIARSSYGSPQSLGCVEVADAVGQAIWPSLTLGSLVSVVG